jgi:hypothetical protein
MGFNYLQTDDRDNYFAQFDKKEKKRPTGITVYNPNGEMIFDNVPYGKVRSYCKKNYLPEGKGAKRIWRGILIEKGYNVITCY